MPNWFSQLFKSLFGKKEKPRDRRQYFRDYYRNRIRTDMGLMTKRRKTAYRFQYHRERPENPKKTSPTVI